MRLAVVFALFTAAFVAYAAYTGATAFMWYVNAPGTAVYMYSGASGAYSVCGISASYKYTPDTSAAGELWLGAVPRIAVIDGVCYRFGAYNETFLLIDYVNKVAYLVVLDSPTSTYNVYTIPYTSTPAIYSNSSSTVVFRFSTAAALRLLFNALGNASAPGHAELIWAPFGQYVAIYTQSGLLVNTTFVQQAYIGYLGNLSWTQIRYRDVYGNVYTIAPAVYNAVIICGLGGCRPAKRASLPAEDNNVTVTVTYTVTNTATVTTTYVNTVYEQLMLPTGGNMEKWIAIIGGTAVVLMLLAVLLSRR